MPRQRLINCDFFGVSGFTKNLSNKAKLLYFFFLANADDKGFVGNGLDLAENLDQCEQDFENVLFQYKYVDALKELVDKRLTYEFSDKVGNKTYLIRHWFLHNKQQKFLTTNFISYLAKVELVNNEYYLKEEKEKPLKEKENKKTKEIKPNETNETKDEEEKELNWDEIMSNLKQNPEDAEKQLNDPFYDCFKDDQQEEQKEDDDKLPF